MISTSFLFWRHEISYFVTFPVNTIIIYTNVTNTVASCPVCSVSRIPTTPGYRYHAALTHGGHEATPGMNIIRILRAPDGPKPAAAAEARRAAMRATPAAPVETPSFVGESSKASEPELLQCIPWKASMTIPWRTPLAGAATMVIFAPGTIALIKRVQTNRQDASSEIDLRRTGFLWSKGVLMLQKEPDTIVSGTHTPRAPIITCSRHPTGIARSPFLPIKGTSVIMANNTTTSSQHGAHSPSDREVTSHVQGSTSPRPASPVTTSSLQVTSGTKSMSLKEYHAKRKQAVATGKLGTPETEKNGNGKRPLDEEEKAIGDAAKQQKRHESAAAREQPGFRPITASATISASATITAPPTTEAPATIIKHVASTEPAAKKSKDAPAASKASNNTAAPATTTTSATATTTTATASSKAPASTQVTAPRMASASTSKASASRMASATNTSKASGSRTGPPTTTNRAPVPSKASASAKPSAVRDTSSVARKTPTARKDSSAATLPATKKAPATRETPAVKKAPAAKESSSAASKPSVAKKTSAATTTPPPASRAAIKAEALKAEAEAAKKSASAAAKKASAASNARPRTQAPPDRFRPTTREERGAKALADKAKHRAAQSATKSKANTAKALLADKTTNTAISKKRRSAVADLDDVAEPQKRRRADATEPARRSGRKAERNENAPQEAKAVKEVKEKEAPKRTARPKKIVAPQALFSDGEESELETVTKEVYEASEKEKREKDPWAEGVKRSNEAMAAEKSASKRARDEGDEEDASPAPKKAKVVEPLKEAAAEESGTKRARDDGEEDDIPAPKKAKVAAPPEKTSGDANSGKDALKTGSDASAATPDEVASPPRKKGVARLTDAQQRKEDVDRVKRNKKSRDNTALLAAERDAIKVKGKTAVQTKNLFM
ncbi:hypothetical protein Q7P36_000575 [Cladosporium allicinum]